MPRTIGYHVVKSCYGQWLPGDERGHWSDAWDDQIGYFEPHMLHEGDPARLRMAQERMKHPPVILHPQTEAAVADALGRCVKESSGAINIVDATIHVTHMHLLIGYSNRDIDITMKWIADQTTKAVHRQTTHQGPVWAKGKWRVFVYTLDHWTACTRYIQSHNQRKHKPTRPYPWLAPAQ